MGKQSRVVRLFKALEEGKILYKDHNDKRFREFLFYDKKNKMLESKGWGSALGQSRDRLESILVYPELWSIHSYPINKGYPYPWSLEYKGI